MPLPPDLSQPLSSEEYDQLDVLIEEATNLDVEGVMGFMTALAVAPGAIDPSTWLPALMSPSYKPDDVALAHALQLLLRYYNEITERVLERKPLMPHLGDELACIAFADGFIDGAVLDPHWKSDAARWKLCEPFAFLSERVEYVAEESLAMFEAMPKHLLCGRLDQLVLAALDAFLPLRGALPTLAASAGPRLRRGDPCPCGSGKKYKRCCMDADREKLRRN
ncbi:MAG: UPF0149 family protein [Polyangiaceae bacterium]|nr:UPF0149 family protein [Polyangiaceae bacterium]